jgi:RNase adaptor protein for sRNA GlmZ degradation
VEARGLDKIDSIVAQAREKKARTIAIGCAAGRHRSVAMAISVARRLGGTARHRDL